MPACLPYFAWIDPTETAFGPEHLRWDEQVFSFALKQDEGDPASLTAVVRRPRNEAGNAIGLLGPGRKIWAWFALDCGPDLIRFRGRLVGVPTSIFEELVTLEFVARPIDLVAQKEALAQTLRVLPHYDEVVIDKDKRTDPEVVLEGYSRIWHYDRETHLLTVSDEIDGEDGLVEFDGISEDGKTLYDGLALSLTSGPLARVDVSAEFTWTQQAQGTVDLTRYLIANWPDHGPNYVTSYTFSAGDWPKIGTGIGDGWIVADATSFPGYDHKSTTITSGSILKFDAGFGGEGAPEEGHTSSFTETLTTVNMGPGAIELSKDIKDDINVQYTDGDWSSFSRSYSQTQTWAPLNQTIGTLVAGYKAGRQCTELVSFSLFADVQHVLTDPEDGEALRIDDVRSINLSETLGEGTDAYLPIGDPRRRSYIATERGNRSVEHLIALARAHLRKRARVVEIAFAPKLTRMPEITLRKNVFLVEPRIGEALGKIIGYSIALDGSDGRVKCEVKIGCAIGRGGSAAAVEGEPTYCEIAYTGADYQQFTGRTVLLDSSVGYEPPIANPNDDGIDFLSALKAEDVIAIGLVVENPAQVQRDRLLGATKDTASEVLRQYATRATFKLKSMTREFSSDYEIHVTELKIPTGYDLEAA